jgi:hypothetical protein
LKQSKEHPMLSVLDTRKLGNTFEISNQVDKAHPNIIGVKVHDNTQTELLAESLGMRTMQDRLLKEKKDDRRRETVLDGIRAGETSR